MRFIENMQNHEGQIDKRLFDIFRLRKEDQKQQREEQAQLDQQAMRPKVSDPQDAVLDDITSFDDASSDL